MGEPCRQAELACLTKGELQDPLYEKVIHKSYTTGVPINCIPPQGLQDNHYFTKLILKVPDMQIYNFNYLESYFFINFKESSFLGYLTPIDI